MNQERYVQTHTNTQQLHAYSAMLARHAHTRIRTLLHKWSRSSAHSHSDTGTKFVLLLHTQTQHTTHNAQHTTHNAQHTTHNTQHTTHACNVHVLHQTCVKELNVVLQQFGIHFHFHFLNQIQFDLLFSTSPKNM